MSREQHQSPQAAPEQGSLGERDAPETSFDPHRGDSPPWLLYGAYGYTGRLLAMEALRRGHRPILAGRREEPLRELAHELEGVPGGLLVRRNGRLEGASPGRREFRRQVDFGPEPQGYRFTAVAGVRALEEVRGRPELRGAVTPAGAFGPGWVLALPELEVVEKRGSGG